MAKVISLGHMGGGSYGAMFNPSTTRELFTVQSAEFNGGDFPKSELVFLDRSAAEKKAEEVSKWEAESAAKRKAAEEEAARGWRRNYPEMQRANAACRVLVERVGGAASAVRPLNGPNGNGMTWGRVPAELAAMHDSLIERAWEVTMGDGRVYQIGQDYRTFAAWVIRELV